MRAPPANWDVELHLGPRNCGKSQYLESSLSAQDQLYVGTLWGSPENLGIITRHQERRGPMWDVFECTGILNVDMDGINSLLRSFEPGGICMVDGLPTWAAHCTLRGHLGPLANGELITAGLSRLIRSFPDLIWRFVSVTPDDFSGHDATLMALAAANIVGSLQRRIPSVRIVKWSEERRMG